MNTPNYSSAGALTNAQVAYLQNFAANNMAGSILLGKLTGANFNSVADQAIAIASTKYIIRKVIVTNASISMSTAQGSLYTAASKGGTALTTSPTTTPYSALTAAAKYTEPTLATLDTQTAAIIYLSLTTAQGVAATADVYLFGDKLD